MKLKQMIEGFVNLVSSTKIKNLNSVINGSVLGALDTFFTEINAERIPKKINKTRVICHLVRNVWMSFMFIFSKQPRRMEKRGFIQDILMISLEEGKNTEVGGEQNSVGGK